VTIVEVLVETVVEVDRVVVVGRVVETVLV
jgi:hypothetical protein